MKRGAVAAYSGSDNHEIVVELARLRGAIAVQGRENLAQIGTPGLQIEARQAQGGRRIRGGAGAERLPPEPAEAERAGRREAGVGGGSGGDRRGRREGERNGGLHYWRRRSGVGSEGGRGRI